MAMTTEQRRDVNNWQAQRLRLTCFPIHSPPENTSPWWVEVTQQEPDATIQRPRDQQSQTAGAVGDAISTPGVQLLLSSEKDRIDWNLTPKTADGAFDTLGTFPTVLSEFQAMLSPWLTSVDADFKRIALGSTILLPVDSHDAGYELLSAYLPFDLDVSSSDFRYRINRPTESQALHDGTRINRLQSWALSRFQVLRFELSAGGGETRAGTSLSGDPLYACNLELDISTAADRSAGLPRDSFDALTKELVEESLHIAELGDQQND